MKEMFQRIGEEMSNDQLLRVYLLLISRDKVFSKGDTDLGTFTAVKHHIDIVNSKPIKQRMKLTPLGYAIEEQEHLEKIPNAGVIEPSCSEWASPSMLVRKRDGSVKWCIDLRKLNDVTVKYCYPLSLLQDCIDALEGCQYFTTLDMASGCYQIDVAEEDRDKTAFVTEYGLFTFCRMSLGLCNAPVTFSRSVSLVLRGLSWKSVIAFLDDVVVLGRDIDSHMVGQQLDEVVCQEKMSDVEPGARSGNREADAPVAHPVSPVEDEQVPLVCGPEVGDIYSVGTDFCFRMPD